MQHIESTLEGADGTSLFMLRHELDEPKAAVVILHGYCEHCLRYGHVVDHFEKQGLNSYLIDHRGHGRSEGPRAAVLRWEEYLDDVEIFLAEVRKHYTEGPLFLLGHSMGGLIATSYVLNRKPKLDGVILSSPYLGLKADVPQWKAVAGKVMSRLWPSISLKSDLDPHLLSHDQAVVQDYISDPNVPKLANARWFTESNKWQEYVQEKASGWGLPALVMHGGDDRIADPSATRRFHEQIPDSLAKLIIFEGMYHEIYNEVDRIQVLNATTDWIAGRLQEG